MKRTIATIIIAERILLREGITSLLHQTLYKVIASVASVSELGDLKLPPERPVLTILGLSDNLGETARLVQDVRRVVHGGKIVAIGERIDDLGFQEILNSGVDGILFNVSSREALLKAFDLAFLEQQIVIIGQPAHSDPHHVGAPPLAPTGTTPMTTRPKPESGPKMQETPQSLRPDLHMSPLEKGRQIRFYLTCGNSNGTLARSCSIAKAKVKAHLRTFMRKLSAQNGTHIPLWAAENRLPSNLGVVR